MTSIPFSHRAASRISRRARDLTPAQAVLTITALVRSSQLRADAEALSLEAAQAALPIAGRLPDPQDRISAINVPINSLALDREDMPLPFSVEQQGESR